ncbi:MAG: hypothetical protein LVR00_06245 [Rhabdochlamydiaceae bacterium]
MKEGFAERLTKAKHYRLYAHPQASFINVEEALSRFAPEVLSHLAALKETPLSRKALLFFADSILIRQLYLPRF